MYRNCTELFVAPGGIGNGKTADRNNGADGPLGSLEDAFILIDQMRGGGMLQPLKVRMLAGEYPLEKPVRIRPNMSSVTVEPYDAGHVLISGGRRLTGFTRSVFNGHECFAVSIPEVKEGKWKFTDLYVDGLRAELPRLPENGYFHMLDTENKDGALFSSSRRFQGELEDVRTFTGLHAFEDCIVSFNHYWIDEHTPVESLDPQTGWVTMEYKTRFTIRPGQEYILENVAESFSKPNHWYLDRAEGMLYYIPRDDAQTPENIQVWAPVVSSILEIEGQSGNPVTGLRFHNLDFAYTRGDYGSIIGTHGEPESRPSASDSQSVSNAHGSINLSYARNVEFIGCSLRNYGVHGINIKEGCRSVRVEKCDLYDGGAGGVRICGNAWGMAEDGMTFACRVADCTMKHLGRRYLSACGVLIMHASEITVEHNEICDLYYTGISCGWVWGYSKSVCRDNRILKNHIYNLGQGLLSDMGGVYLLGAQPGTVVSGNVIHDIKCKEYGGWALYTDEGSAGILLEKNICYNTSSNSYHQHYGSSNVVRNNVFADADAPLLCVSRPEAHLSILFVNNILYSKGGAILSDYTQASRGALPITEGAVVCENNLMFCANGELLWCPKEGLHTLADAQKAGMEQGSAEKDPMFVNPAEHDYTLRADSPAFAMGFVPVDSSDAGPRR